MNQQNNQTNQPSTPTASTQAPMPTSAQKSSKGMIIGMVACIILAIAGLCFGVVGMTMPKSSETSAPENQTGIGNDAIETPAQEQNKTDSTPVAIQENPTVDNLHLVNDIYSHRRYYLGITDLDASKDSREIDTYLIDITKLGTSDGVRKYDLKTKLDQIVNEWIASLPDTLAAGTVNATPKAKCVSYKTRVGDVLENPKGIDWAYGKEWDDLLPLTVYLECNINDGNTISMSLGTNMYILDIRNDSVTKYIENWY